MVTITLNGQAVEVAEGSTLLEAATAAGVNIPTLCYLKDLNCIGGPGPGGGVQHRRCRGHGRAHRHPAGSRGASGEPAGHHGRPSGALRHLRAPGHLRPALPFQHLQPAGCRRGPAGAGAVGCHLPAAARQQQVHQVHALRGHLRQGAALRRVAARCAASASPTAPRAPLPPATT